MTFFFGEDFRKAVRGWQYPTAPMQGLWRGIGLFVLLFGVFEIIMVPVIAGLVTHFGFGVPLVEFMGPKGPSPEFMQGFLVGTFPAMLLLLVLNWGLMPRGLPQMQGRLPLAWARLGLVGWILVIALFMGVVTFVIAMAFHFVGVDTNSTKGLIESSMQDLARDKWRYALIIPGVALGAPVAEELLFRGYLFAALAPTRIGRVGAVLVTSALWSVAHAGPAPWAIVGGIFIMGLVLGVVLLRFGSLWVTIAMHATWNGVQSAMLFMLGNS
jgi:membrane protease YdiL (CAAX protease family)